MAFGSTRVMATCAVVGQAGGTAAAMAVEKGISPREINNHVKELQQKLLKDDCYIPGFKNEDENDLARKTSVSCSSSIAGGECENVINGISRKINETSNCWISDELSETGEWIALNFDKKISAGEVHVKFDSNLSKELMVTMSESARAKQIPGIPPELAKNYSIEFYMDDKLVYEEKITDNYLRFKVHKLQKPVICNKVKVNVFSTHGDSKTRIFEIRVY
jgi:hypothetical protein